MPPESTGYSDLRTRIAKLRMTHTGLARRIKKLGDEMRASLGLMQEAQGKERAGGAQGHEKPAP